MRNNIYDFSEIGAIRLRQNRLILCYVLYALCFIAAIALCCILIENNLLLTTVFALLSLLFILFSVCFFKIKYGILKNYRAFLEDFETGHREELFGRLENIISASDDEWFDTYVFSSHEDKRELLVHKSAGISLDEGCEYRLIYIGKYLLEWEK